MLKFLLLAFIRALTGAKPTWPVCGSPVGRVQTIFFSNHTSHLDTIVILSILDGLTHHVVRPVAARDYWDKGPIRRYIATNILRAVFITRAGTDGVDPLVPLRQALQEGDSLIVFPEGTRSDGTMPQPFKRGLHVLASEFPNVALVPLYLENLNRIMPKGALLPIPLISKVYVGAPLAVIEGESRESFLNRARDAVIALSGSNT